MADNRIVGGGFTDNQARPPPATLRRRSAPARRRSRSLLRRLSAIPRRVRRGSLPADERRRRQTPLSPLSYRWIRGHKDARLPSASRKDSYLPAGISQRDSIQMSGKGQRFTALRPGRLAIRLQRPSPNDDSETSKPLSSSQSAKNRMQSASLPGGLMVLKPSSCRASSRVAVISGVPLASRGS